MKKNGFVLLETLIATTLLATVFTIIYIEFKNISEKYKMTYNNNSVEKIYETNNIKNYILANGYENIVPLTEYTDITYCQVFTSNRLQCENLIKTLEIKKVYLGPDETDYKVTLMQNNEISDNLKKFIRTFKDSNSVGNYRLIVEFQDGECATLRM